MALRSSGDVANLGRPPLTNVVVHNFLPPDNPASFPADRSQVSAEHSTPQVPPTKTHLPAGQILAFPQNFSTDTAFLQLALGAFNRNKRRAKLLCPQRFDELSVRDTTRVLNLANRLKREARREK